MATIKKSTTDKQGNIYKKIFANFREDTGAIVCLNKKNKKFAVKPNFSLRLNNKGKFGEEIILQFVISNVKEEYTSKSPFENHIETYFPINEETLELFEEFTNLIKEEIKSKNKLL